MQGRISTRKSPYPHFAWAPGQLLHTLGQLDVEHYGATVATGWEGSAAWLDVEGLVQDGEMARRMAMLTVNQLHSHLRCGCSSSSGNVGISGRTEGDPSQKSIHPFGFTLCAAGIYTPCNQSVGDLFHGALPEAFCFRVCTTITWLLLRNMHPQATCLEPAGQQRPELLRAKTHTLKVHNCTGITILRKPRTGHPRMALSYMHLNRLLQFKGGHPQPIEFRTRVLRFGTDGLSRTRQTERSAVRQPGYA
eukprot:1158095-Pelagomonas_calceolata.AAC.1